MAKIKGKHVVTKRNILNEMRASSMTLQELRFFSIYLSKINPRKTDTRVVRFSLQDFQAIMELGRINISYLKTVSGSLLSKIINVSNERGGYEAFQLFKKCKVDIDENGEWYFEIDAHDDALPLMFDFKDRFFSYELWNALRLKSSNQIRMYEILKQYEPIGHRIVSIENLKEELGLDKNEYPRFDNFKNRVLESCQEALEESTDIKFTYEPYGKKGPGGKILALKFTIKKNSDYIDQLTLAEFIDQATLTEFIDQRSEPDAFEIDEENVHTQMLDFVSGACRDEFKASELQVLLNLAIQIFPHEYGAGASYSLKIYDLFQRKYDEMSMRAEKTKIHNRFGYLKALFEADL